MRDKQKIVVDTNIFMESIDVLKKLTEDYSVVVPLITLEELDNLKDSRNDSRTHKARIAIKYLNANYDDFIFDNKEYEGKPDNQIISVAEHYKSALATNDICVKVKSKIKNIEVLSFLGNEQEYKGYRMLEINTNENNDNELLARLYQYPCENILDLYINEYLIIKDKANPIFDEDYDCKMDYKTLDILRWDGQEYVKLKYPPKKVIIPLNDLQRCAVDLLGNKDIPIRVIAGTFGSGKTLLTTAMGVHAVEEKGHYSKLVLVRNNDAQSGKDVGALPGTLEDKTDILFKTITQHFPQGEYQAHKMMNEGRMECHIPYFMKGLSINGYMIVDEAEDLTLKDIKMVGSRIEKDGCINFAGDWKQTGGKYLSDNGMIQLIDQTKNNPLVGVIVLDEDVRSDASKVFADLI